MNLNKLKACYVEKGMNLEDMLNKIGMSKTRYYRCIENNTFTVEDVKNFKNALDLSFETIRAIFFE